MFSLLREAMLYRPTGNWEASVLSQMVLPHSVSCGLVRKKVMWHEHEWLALPALSRDRGLGAGSLSRRRI